MFPEPLAAKPTAVFELVQAYVVPVVAEVKFVAAKLAPAHTVCEVGCATTGVGLTVIVYV